MTLKVIEEDNRFRVEWQEDSEKGSLDWLPDTASNRKAALVFLRLLQDEKGKAMFTFQELSVLFGSNNRQASSGPMERFRDCGSDILCFLTRKRKVDWDVVEGVLQELLDDPLADIKELQVRTNIRLVREDLTEANIHAALEQISCNHIRGAIREQLSKGEAHYQEQYLLEEMMSSKSFPLGERAGIQIPEDKGMVISDPTSIRNLIVPDVSISTIKDTLKWVVYCMVLYYYGVPLSVLSAWTTILRWMIGLSLELFPLVYKWILAGVKGSIVYIDEKWIKIRGKWHYWFVVLDSETGMPVVASLLGTKSHWACRWIGTKLKEIGKIPRVIITDGLLGYRHIIEGARHVLCRFHHQQGVTRWLKKKLGKEAKIDPQKKEMKRVLQTEDKRTVRRRLARLKESSEAMGIKEWVEETEANLPKLLPSVGSKRIPKTTNAIERFFRAFNRFYKVRCGFFSVVSAKRELILFLLMYLFIRQPESGKAPIETIVPEASRMPLYQLINDPFGTILGVENVKKNVKVADFKAYQSLSA